MSWPLSPPCSRRAFSGGRPCQELASNPASMAPNDNLVKGSRHGNLGATGGRGSIPNGEASDPESKRSEEIGFGASRGPRVAVAGAS
jgi:hypothetical protein